MKNIIVFIFLLWMIFIIAAFGLQAYYGVIAI